LVACGYIAGAVHQRLQWPLELAQQFAWGEGAGADSDQLDRQWQPIQAFANGRVDSAVALIRWQDGASRSRALNKELYRICIGEGLECHLLFSADSERRPARHEHGESGAGGQQLGHKRRSFDDMFEIVEYEQQVFRTHMVTQGGANTTLRALL